MKVVKIYKYKDKDGYYAQILFPSPLSYYKTFLKNKEKILNKLKKKFKKIDLDICIFNECLEKLINKNVQLYPYYITYVDLKKFDIHDVKEIK